MTVCDSLHSSRCTKVVWVFIAIVLFLVIGCAESCKSHQSQASEGCRAWKFWGGVRQWWWWQRRGSTCKYIFLLPNHAILIPLKMYHLSFENSIFNYPEHFMARQLLDWTRSFETITKFIWRGQSSYLRMIFDHPCHMVSRSAITKIDCVLFLKGPTIS